MKSKFLNIEFLRFFFVLAVLVFHFFFVFGVNAETVRVYFHLKLSTAWARYAVEFFFIISGFFMFLNIDKYKDTCFFAKKRLFRFVPGLILVSLLYVIVARIIHLQININDVIFQMLNLQDVGLTLGFPPVIATWFVSALFWTQLFYFYLYKLIDKRWFNLFTACIIFICYSTFLYSNTTKGLTLPYIFNSGCVRAFAGIGLGYFISM